MAQQTHVRRAHKRSDFDPAFRQAIIDRALKGDKTQRAVAEEMGVGLSTLQRYLQQAREEEKPSAKHGALSEQGQAKREKTPAAELERLRVENDILRGLVKDYAREAITKH